MAGGESRDAAHPILVGRCQGLRAICGSHRSTPYSAYDPETYSGHWKQLTVRISRRGQAMAIAYFHPQVSSGWLAGGGVSGPEQTSTQSHGLFLLPAPESEPSGAGGAEGFFGTALHGGVRQDQRGDLPLLRGGGTAVSSPGGAGRVSPRTGDTDRPTFPPTERPPAKRACLWSTWPGTSASARTCWG